MKFWSLDLSKVEAYIKLLLCSQGIGDGDREEEKHKRVRRS